MKGKARRGLLLTPHIAAEWWHAEQVYAQCPFLLPSITACKLFFPFPALEYTSTCYLKGIRTADKLLLKTWSPPQFLDEIKIWTFRQDMNLTDKFSKGALTKLELEWGKEEKQFLNSKTHLVHIHLSFWNDAHGGWCTIGGWRKEGILLPQYSYILLVIVYNEHPLYYCLALEAF